MLYRSKLIEILNDFDLKVKYMDRNSIDKKVYEEYLLKILSELNSVTCNSDLRFVTYGRRDFLREELEKKLELKEYCDAFYDISNFVRDTYISISNIPEGLNKNEIIDKDIEYKKDGFICNEEKDILIKMINKYLSSINDDKFSAKEDQKKVYTSYASNNELNNKANENYKGEVLLFKGLFQKLFKRNGVSKELSYKVQEFAKEHGYKKANYLTDWNGYKCFEPVFDETRPSFVGLPLLILVDSNNNIRMSTREESMQQIRDSK